MAFRLMPKSLTDDYSNYSGLPAELKKQQSRRGNTAVRTTFGSSLQACCRNRDRQRIISNWGHEKFVALPFNDGGVIGSKIALFAGPATEALATIGVSPSYQDYVNAFSGAEPQYTPYSNITPGLGELQVFYNGAYSSYNALQVEARKISPAHGLQFQANYTWGKVMTDADDLWNVGGRAAGPPKTTLNA